MTDVQATGRLLKRAQYRNHRAMERAPGKGRVVEHRLTAAGKKMLAAGNAVALGVATRAFAQLSRAEIAKLHELLLRVGEVIE